MRSDRLLRAESRNHSRLSWDILSWNVSYFTITIQYQPSVASAAVDKWENVGQIHTAKCGCLVEAKKAENHVEDPEPRTARESWMCALGCRSSVACAVVSYDSGFVSKKKLVAHMTGTV